MFNVNVRGECRQAQACRYPLATSGDALDRVKIA
jgi:hypothetical protein